MSLERDDFSDWRDYVAGELDAWRADELLAGDFVWKDDAAARAHIASASRRYGCTDTELLAYMGPWHVARRHVRREFRQWVEESMRDDVRVTFTDWQARAREARALAVTNADAEASPIGALTDLGYMVRLVACRDELIFEAASKGASKAEIARTVGITRQQVYNVLRAQQALADAEAARLEASVASFEFADELEWNMADAF